MLGNSQARSPLEPGSTGSASTCDAVLGQLCKAIRSELGPEHNVWFVQVKSCTSYEHVQIISVHVIYDVDTACV